MNCERARDHLIEFTDGRLPEALSAEIQEHLDHCPACREEFSSLTQMLGTLDAQRVPSPSARMRLKVNALIESEKRSHASPPSERTPHRLWWLAPVQALAACALLAAGFVAGEHHASAPAPVAAPDPASQKEIADLRARVDSMGQLVNASLLGQRSGNDRLQGILASAAAPRPNQTVIDGLITTLALDPSVNVRLNALEALYPHADQDVVRAGVLESLPRESNPIVQIAMIDFLVASHDQEAGTTLHTLSDNSAANPDVRAAAKRALTEY